jgi:hypothetical protein
MCDPAGVHITRIYVSCSRGSPSPIRPSNSAPVCTSTPINNVALCQPSHKQQMALVAKEILKAQRSTETFIQKPESPIQQIPQFTSEVPQPPPPPPAPSSETFVQKLETPKHDEYVFLSKETGQKIDLTSGDGIGKIANLNTGTVTKKKKSRQSLAVVPPPSSTRTYSTRTLRRTFVFILYFRFVEIK